jgi:hypothetical protein
VKLNGPRPWSPPRSAFTGFRFPADVIMAAVRWYLRYNLSHRDVEELLVERLGALDRVDRGATGRWGGVHPGPTGRALWVGPMSGEWFAIPRAGQPVRSGSRRSSGSPIRPAT